MNDGRCLWPLLGICLAGLVLAAVPSAVAAQGGASLEPSQPHAEAPAIKRPPTVGVQGGEGSFTASSEDSTIASLSVDEDGDEPSL